MPPSAPPVYREDPVAKTEQLLELYSSWRTLEARRRESGPGEPEPEPDSGWALVRAFARLVEVVAERVNAAPDKNFIAFLDLVGVRLLPPRPARVPLTFLLASGTSSSAIVPRGTLVAATPLAGEEEPPVFETEEELVATPAQLVAAFTRDPREDRNADRTAAVGGGAGAWAPFDGKLPNEHLLYVGDAELLALAPTKQVVIHIQPGGASLRWPVALAWERWDGSAWTRVRSLADPEGPLEAGMVTLPQVPSIPATTLAGRTSSFLRARLRTTLPRGELQVDDEGASTTLSRGEIEGDAAFADELPLDLRRPFRPLLADTDAPAFYLACDDAFSKPGAKVRIEVSVGGLFPYLPLIWSFSSGSEHEPWMTLGETDRDQSGPQGPYDFRDTTGGFSDDGWIEFLAPDDWADDVLGGRRAYWLRAKLWDRLPASSASWVERLRISYEWPLPVVRAVEIEVTANETLPRPDLAFANQDPLDLNKDFFPFGERPRQNDAFYLAADEALATPGAKVTLAVALSPPPPEPSAGLSLAWEYWDMSARRWAMLGASSKDGSSSVGQAGFDDGTRALTRDGSVVFTRVPTLGPVEVSGETRNWIRARIASGNYGTEFELEPVSPPTSPQTYRIKSSGFKPPLVKSLEVKYELTRGPQPVDALLTENDFALADRTPAERWQNGTERINPFTPPKDTRPTLYLGFSRPFENRPTTLYLEVADAPFSPDRPAGLPEPPAVTWEYRAPEGWKRLETRDETASLTGRGLVTFVGPADLVPASEFGVHAAWLRVRWERGEYWSPPRLVRVLTNTTWAQHARTVENEILGSSTGEPGQSFRLTGTPVLTGQEIEVRELEPPPPEEIAELGDDAVTTVLDESGRPVEVWVRWLEVVDFHASGPRSRHYVLDRLTGQTRFGDGVQGMIPPYSRNGIRAAHYRTGGGIVGNRAAGTVTELESTVPYVDAVVNHEPAAGGTDGETMADVRERGPRTLRHRDRAVAIADFEDLAREAAPGIARAVGIPARSGAGAGRVGVIVVPISDEPKPAPTVALIEQVEQHLRERAAPTFDVDVVGPGWVRVSVEVEVVPVTLERATDVENAIVARIEAFLNPLTGGSEGIGWAFGRRPHRSDLHRIVEETPGVAYVRTLAVTSVETDASPMPGAFLVYSGPHTVTIVGGGS